jgi:hypothetical protein
VIIVTRLARGHDRPLEAAATTKLKSWRAIWPLDVHERQERLSLFRLALLTRFGTKNEVALPHLIHSPLAAMESKLTLAQRRSGHVVVRQNYR